MMTAERNPYPLGNEPESSWCPHRMAWIPNRKPKPEPKA